MRIAYIAAGAAGMYCGSCLHDNTLARALMDQGEDVVLVPTYTPIRTDEVDVSHQQVFYGGINVYLQQKFPLFRRTPRWIDWLFDQRWMLNLATRGGPSVDPSKLGDMTVSMLSGEKGHQRKELDRLVDWLLQDIKPDVVHLSNSMLLGFAGLISQRCGPPVVCSLSGEDIFLEKLTPPYYEQARALLRERATDCQAFVSLNEYYAHFMSDYLAVEPERVHVISHGLDLDGHAPASKPPPQLIVGCLARICHDKGLHLLVEACEHLRETAPEIDFRLQAAGYLGKSDEPYLREIEQRVATGPLAGRFEYLGELDRAGKIAFLQSLSVFALPTVYAESKGLPVLEAWANGLPVLLPDHGSFPEMVADTSAGVLHVPHDTHDLAGQLANLLLDAEMRAELGQAGRRAVEQRYQAVHMAQAHMDLYRSLAAP
ncbi:glycosyltransferase family 4 protein [Aeoliella sp. ICT_H6.2]|uniref:Glycosyltransferase family 4 protein n=1 Tax=Aeoliella straminimaris TaxID=2954799 RepID=A0A9X2FGW9_9BACT|nr:glycosyltransferase family 4 protein [Aeoliella straminimaris]MCO6046309.1 glycosyltransferase family 4 protein [Aeoliella straminimaris]